MTDEAAKQKLYDFMRARGQGVIATAGPDGRPEAALMDIVVTPALEIIFETTDQTRKFANLTARPAISFVVGWNGDETLQYDGIVQQPAGRALEEIQRLYVERFPHKASHPDWPGNHYFLVRPSWIRFSNYRTPRKIEEFRFELENAPAPQKSWWNKLAGVRNA